MADNILEVKKLKISFRTNNGTVKAIRDISFDLKRGETLAIVGESGSGKSVTSKAILGISAGNAIIDSGEILYDGKDLLKLSEDEMYKIRGDKISMIFQDPLSSLNPIVKIGQQIIEALILKNKDSRKNARKEFNQKLEVLKLNMNEALGTEQSAEIEELIKSFDSFAIKSLELETDYNESHTVACEIISLLEDFLFKASKQQKLDIVGSVKLYLSKLNKVSNAYLVSKYHSQFISYKDKLSNLISENKGKFNAKDSVKKVFTEVDSSKEVSGSAVNVLTEFKEFLSEVVAQEKPDFFTLGYYLYANPEIDLSSTYNAATKASIEQFFKKSFLDEFLGFVEKAIINSYNKSKALKKAVINELKELKAYFKEHKFEQKEALQRVEFVGNAVNESIDKLDVIKDSLAYTFKGSLLANVKSYFYSVKSNAKEKIRFEKQTAKQEALKARGKKVDWKVVPMKIVDLEDLVENIVSKIQRLEDKYQAEVEQIETITTEQKANELIKYLQVKASEVVYTVTKSLAKEQALKLMEEVGIPEPRIRYYQYPFEFSGGMRQRIVIAIALASNPDILICDEPTTALDVTIQSQILELINKLKKERNLSVIFITHDLGVVANMADRIAVMYAGKIVEYGTSEEVFYSPAHPYTWALLSSMPDLKTTEKLDAIPGTPPNMIYPPKGDAFAARNKYAMKIDFEKQPPYFKVSDTHYAATWLLHPNAPKVEMPKIIKDRIERMKETGGSQDGQ